MAYMSGTVGNGVFTYNKIHRHLFSYFQIYNETISSAEKEKKKDDFVLEPIVKCNTKSR